MLRVRWSASVFFISLLVLSSLLHPVSCMEQDEIEVGSTGILFRTGDLIEYGEKRFLPVVVSSANSRLKYGVEVRAQMGDIVEEASFLLEPNSSREVRVKLPPGERLMSLRISAEYPKSPDDVVQLVEVTPQALEGLPEILSDPIHLIIFLLILPTLSGGTGYTIDSEMVFAQLFLGLPGILESLAPILFQSFWIMIWAIMESLTRALKGAIRNLMLPDTWLEGLNEVWDAIGTAPAFSRPFTSISLSGGPISLMAFTDSTEKILPFIGGMINALPVVLLSLNSIFKSEALRVFAARLLNVAPEALSGSYSMIVEIGEREEHPLQILILLGVILIAIPVVVIYYRKGRDAR